MIGLPLPRYGNSDDPPNASPNRGTLGNGRRRFNEPWPAFPDRPEDKVTQVAPEP
jgi:hypothetical protein